MKKKTCSICEDTGYIEVEVVYPVSFLPNIGYITKQKQICEDCDNGIEARRQKSERQFKEGNTEPRANGAIR
jgi:hypothetical protein